MKKLLLTLGLCLFASSAYAAIGFDKTSNSGGKGASPFTWTHLIESTTTNNILIVACGNDVGSGTPVTISSMTYATVRMVKVRRDVASFIATEIWYATGPISGTNTISVTFTGTAGAGDFMVCGAVSLFGVDQTNPVDAQNAATATSGVSSTTVTTVADNTWMVDVFEKDDTGAATKGASQTQAWQVSQTTQFARTGGSYRGPVTPAQKASMTWTFSSILWGQSAASFQPASATPTGRTRRLLLSD